MGVVRNGDKVVAMHVYINLPLCCLEKQFTPKFYSFFKAFMGCERSPDPQVERKLNCVEIRITCETSVLILWFATAEMKKKKNRKVLREITTYMRSDVAEAGALADGFALHFRQFYLCSQSLDSCEKKL